MFAACRIMSLSVPALEKRPAKEYLFLTQYFLNTMKTKSICIGLDSSSFDPVLQIGRGAVFGVELNMKEWAKLVNLVNSIYELVTCEVKLTFKKSLSHEHELVCKEVLGDEMLILKKKGTNQCSQNTVYFYKREWERFMEVLPCVKHAVKTCEVMSLMFSEYFDIVLNNFIEHVRLRCFGCRGISIVHTCTEEQFIIDNFDFALPKVNHVDVDGERMKLELKLFCKDKLVERACDELFRRRSVEHWVDGGYDETDM